MGVPMGLCMRGKLKAAVSVSMCAGGGGGGGEKLTLLWVFGLVPTNLHDMS